MENRQGLYTIGQIAELCNVSAKQLRYYDEKGILSPAHKDDMTMYRYYTDEQIQAILLLKELKQIDLPLKDIAELLKERDVTQFRSKLRQKLDCAREELQNALNKFDQTSELFMRMTEAAEFLGRAANEGSDIDDIRFVTFNPRRVVFTRYESYWNAEDYFTAERRTEIYKFLDEYELQPHGSFMAVFHGGYMHQFSNDPAEHKGDLEVCLAVANSKDCPYCRKIGGFQAVSTTYIGHYRDSKKAYLMMEEWAKAQGIELMDVAIEEYVNGVTTARDESELVTRIYIPIKGSVV